MFINCVLEFAFCKGKGSAFYKPTIMGDAMTMSCFEDILRAKFNLLVIIQTVISLILAWRVVSCGRRC